MTNSPPSPFLRRDILGGLGSIAVTAILARDMRGEEAWQPPSGLSMMSQRAKRVIWICTEPRSNWGFGDSEMPNYARAVTQVVTVTSLGDLEKIAPQLIPT